MATESILRYPAAISGNAPFIMFSRHRARYDEAATAGSAAPKASVKGEVNGAAQDGGVILEEAGKVAMYLPMGISIGDSMVYETAATGAIGTGLSALARGAENLDISSFDDIKNVGDALGNQFDNFSADIKAGTTKYGGAMVGGASAALANKLGSGVLKSLLGGAAIGLGTNVALQEAAKSWQAAINPREFLLFKAPSMRAFSLSFRFIPESPTEAQTVEDIIKWFRVGMYPEITGAGFAYVFPDAFQLTFKNVEGIPNLPEMFLESATTTYNPNSMSYYKQGNRPVEVTLSLNFKELQPLNRQLVENGGF